MEQEFNIFSWKKTELVLVISVLLFTFGISFWQLKTSQAKTRDSQRKADVELVARGLSAYYEDHETYPLADEQGNIIACGSAGQEVCSWGGGPLVDAQEVSYINNLPQDPFTYKGQKYVYVPSENRNNFKIYVSLEIKSDPGIRSNLTITCGNRVQCNWYASD